GIPEGSRASISRLTFMKELVADKAKASAVDRLEPIAGELGCTLAQLALAWCLKNENVASVITGASRAAQVEENMKAVDVAAKLTQDVVKRMEEIAARVPE